MCDETKQCKKCGEWKPLIKFYQGSNLCRECVSEYGRGYNQRLEIKKINYIYGINRRAKMLRLPHTLTVEQWEHALNYFNGCCVICEKQLNGMFGIGKIHADHFIPLSYDRYYNPGSVATNMLPLCSTCNISKSNTPPGIWLQRKFGKHKTGQILEKILRYFDSLQIDE